MTFKRWKYLENNFFTCMSHDLKYDVRPVVASQEDAFFNFSAKLVAIAVRSYYYVTANRMRNAIFV